MSFPRVACITAYGVATFVLVPCITLAADPGLIPPPLPKSAPREQVAIPDKIETLKPGAVDPLPLFHHFTLRLDEAFATRKSKNDDMPEKTNIKDTTVTVGFKAGEKFSGSLGAGISDNSIRSRNSVANGAIPIDGNVDGKSYRVMAAYNVLPMLAVGASYGYYDNSGAYQYNIAVPRTDANGHSSTYSLFANGVVANVRGWLVTTGLGYNKTRQDYTFTNNVPPTQTSYFDVVTGSLGLVLPVNEKLRFDGSLTVNHTLSQSNLNGMTGLDSTWLSAAVGMNYRLTKSFDINAGAFAWLNSGKNEFKRATIGLGYHF